MQLLIHDCGGRRSGSDRREFSYTYHIPERRSGDGQRCAIERRNIFNRTGGAKRKIDTAASGGLIQQAA
jgi:hypothetical protein